VAASDPNHPNRFLFTGREFDAETGLYYYRARYYNPTLGRFLQTDPIGYEGGMNMFGYCGNNATNSVDPYGLAEQAYAYVVDGDSVMYLYDDPEVWGTYKWNTDGVSYHYAVAPEGLLHVGDIGGVPVFVIDRGLGAFSIESLGHVTLGGEQIVTDASICEAVLAMAEEAIEEPADPLFGPGAPEIPAPPDVFVPPHDPVYGRPGPNIPVGGGWPPIAVPPDGGFGPGGPGIGLGPLVGPIARRLIRGSRAVPGAILPATPLGDGTTQGHYNRMAWAEYKGQRDLDHVLNGPVPGCRCPLCRPRRGKRFR